MCTCLSGQSNELGQCVPQKKHTKQETKSALQYIKGVETFVRVHADGSGEIDQACKEMEVLHTILPPGIPQKNSKAERSNRHVLEGARTLMENSGVPQRFWTYAVTYFCLSNNAWNWKADILTRVPGVRHSLVERCCTFGP